LQSNCSTYTVDEVQLLRHKGQKMQGRKERDMQGDHILPKAAY